MTEENPGPEDEQDLWPPFYLAGRGGRAARDQGLHDHVRRHREHGSGPPRRARSLSRAEIVRAAIAVADAEGPDAISMRRIARELNAGAMSLYWHVASKEELLDRMLDAVDGEMQAPEPTGDWRADLAAIARNQRAALHRHRWIMDFIGGRPPTGPNQLRNAERGLAALDGAGVGRGDAIGILMAVGTYATGAFLREVQEMRAEQDWKREVESAGEEEIAKLMAEYWGSLRASGRYPRLMELADAGIDPDAADTRDERFEFGLSCLLDGIAGRLAAG